MQVRKRVDDYLNEVDFDKLNDGSYLPKQASLNFVNFHKMAAASGGMEANKTPVMHLCMLDGLFSKEPRIVNLCARGVGKTTLYGEMLVLYLAAFGKLDGFGVVNGMLYVSDSMENGVKSFRESIEARYQASPALQTWIPYARFTENYIEFKNKNGHRFGVKMFGAKSGIRGTKIFGNRPELALMDDLISDADAKSKTALHTIKDTIYKSITYALSPLRSKKILNGTPFNMEDPMYEAVESGQWKVNVWPVCEEFPCSRENFRGAWPDRFTYDYVLDQYNTAKGTGTLDGFRQELMLRITSEESKLVPSNNIIWKSRPKILNSKSMYNFYITTDFATSSKQTADYSIISVWAYDKDGNWIWVDGVCKRQTMDKTIDALFSLVKKYNPQSVGIETSGQQGGFISWLQNEMHYREHYFNLTKHNGSLGIKPTTDKLSRFNLIVPQFTNHKIWFPEELRDSEIIGLFLEQISLATSDGIKGKDDCIDTISMLQYMNPWKPDSEHMVEGNGKSTSSSVWGDLNDPFTEPHDKNEYDRYTV